MKKLVLIVLAVLIIFVGVAAVLYFGGFLKRPEVQSIRMSWGEVTSEETQVNGEVEINNRLPVGLGSSNVSLEVPVEFYEVPAFSLALPELRLEKGNSVLRVNGAFRQAELPGWWPHFVNNGEVLAIKVRPEVRARLLGRQLGTQLPDIETEAPIPLLRNMASDQAQTMGFDDAPFHEIALDPESHFVVGPPGPSRPILTLESWELHWGAASQETTQLLGAMVLKNETAVPLPIQGLGLGLDMNQIRVLPDARLTPDRPYLPPGQSVPVRLDAQIDNARLVEWWTSHLQQDEETTVTTRIGITIVLPAAFSDGLLDDIELPLVPVPGFRCFMSTDIMGVANYEIAQAIGTEAGERAEAASVDCPTPPAPTMGEVSGILPETAPLPTGIPELPSTLPVPMLTSTESPSP